MKGILMRPDMIQAIVEGRKTNTRRLDGLKEVNKEPDKYVARAVWDFSEWIFYRKFLIGNAFDIRVKPRYEAGETVYIKEAWRLVGRVTEGNSPRLEVQYAADMFRRWFSTDQASLDKYTCKTTGGVNSGWRTPLFMPEWAARHFITIVAVRAERLQGISELDVIAEGIEEWEGMFKEYNKPNSSPGWTRNPILSYQTLWDSLNPKYPWESNPWVFPYEFELVKER